MEVSLLEGTKDGMTLLSGIKNLSFSSLSSNVHLLQYSPSHQVVPPCIHYLGQKSKDDHWPFTIHLSQPHHIQSVTKPYPFDLPIFSKFIPTTPIYAQITSSLMWCVETGSTLVSLPVLSSYFNQHPDCKLYPSLFKVWLKDPQHLRQTLGTHSRPTPPEDTFK